MFSVGIIGLPNVGKSTLFKALTKISVPIANYPFTTIDPHHGIVEVKDKRLEKIKEIVRPQKSTPPTIEFIDIAGLVKGAHRGEGLGNQFLSNIGEADLLLEVVKNFSISSDNIENKSTTESHYHLWERPNPERDINIIKEEILERDKKIILNFVSKKEKPSQEEQQVLNSFLKKIDEKVWLFDYLKTIDLNKKIICENVSKKLGLISIKPIIYLLNTIEEKNSSLNLNINNKCIYLNIKEEEELSEMSDKEKKEINAKSYLDEIISSCYNELDLITFYTIKGGIEVRAIEIKKDSSILEAAEKVHSDFKERFISAEIAKFQDFVSCGSWHTMKEKGLIKAKGKEYTVQDGDIIEFKI